VVEAILGRKFEDELTAGHRRSRRQLGRKSEAPGGTAMRRRHGAWGARGVLECPCW
jgi:hypothetical protein